MEIIITVVALLIAIWQLNAQRKEISQGNNIQKKTNEIQQKSNEIQQNTNEIERLKIILDIVNRKIDLQEKIIADKKEKLNGSKTTLRWETDIQPHIDRVNNKLRPSRDIIHNQILELFEHNTNQYDELTKILNQEDNP